MSDLLQDSFTRMKAGAFSVYGLHNLAEWLCKYTFINGKPFNFKDREFQLALLNDTSQTQIVVKPAQTGLSELAYRWAVATCCIMQDWNCIYTFPTATDASNNNKTRINPMIEGSPELKRLVDSELNNSEIKKFGKNSFLFFKGTMADTQALSTPANAVIHDEADKSDMDNLTTYVSRLQDREHKIRKVFSTPTVEGHGVAKEARTAQRMLHLVQCNKCNHSFLPDYFQHIVIPEWDKPLDEITKDNLHEVRWREAHILCPKCGRDPELHHERMPWVCENLNEDHHAKAWFVSPFSAHKRITAPNLVKNSTEYKKYSEFKNQALGLTAEEKNEAITGDDIEKAQSQPFTHSSDIHQMGVDLGLMCNVTVGRELQTGELMVVHRERVRYMQLESRVAELRAQYNITVSVNDSQPYSDIVNRLCGANTNAWGAVYINSKSTSPFYTKSEEEDMSEGKMGFRVVNINRNVALDELLALVKAGKLLVSKSDENSLFRKQMLSMKRVQKFTNQGELVHVWVKTDGEDHYHNSLLYLYIATKMRYMAGTPGFSAANILPLMVIKKPKRHHTHG